MSLPTRQDLAGLEHLLLARTVASVIHKRRHDLADRVVLDENPPVPMVRMVLADGRAVVLVRAQDQNVVSWVIGTPDGHVARIGEPGGAGAIASLMVAAYLRFAG